MDIRLSKRADSSNLAMISIKVSQEFWRKDYTKYGRSTFEKNTFPREFDYRLRSDSYFTLICIIDDVTVGYIAVKDYEQIEFMCVLPEYIDRGVAEEMWARAQEHCLKMGFGKYCWVRSSSRDEPVYESLGFRQSGEKSWLSGFLFQLMEFGQNES